MGQEAASQAPPQSSLGNQTPEREQVVVEQVAEDSSGDEDMKTPPRRIPPPRRILQAFQPAKGRPRMVPSKPTPTSARSLIMEKNSYQYLPKYIGQALASVRAIIRRLDVAMWEEPRKTYKPQIRHCLSAMKILAVIVRRLGFIHKQRGPGFIDLSETGKIIILRDQLQSLASQPESLFPRMWKVLRPGFPDAIFGEPLTVEKWEYKRSSRHGDQEMEISEESADEEEREAPANDDALIDDNYEVFNPDQWITEMEEAELLKDIDVDEEIEGLFNEPLGALEELDTPMISPRRGQSRPPAGVPKLAPKVDWEPVRRHLGHPAQNSRGGQGAVQTAKEVKEPTSRFQPMMSPGRMSEKIPAYFLQGPFPKQVDLKGETLLRYFQKNVRPLFNQQFSGKTSPDSLTFQGFMKLFWNHIGQLQVPEQDKFTVLYQLLEGSAYNLVSPLILSLPADAYRRALEILYANYGDVLVAKQRLDEHLELLKPETNTKVAQRNFVIAVSGMYTRFLELEIPPASFVPRLIERILRYVGGGATASYFEGMARLGLKKADFYVGNEVTAFEDFTSYVSEYLWSRAEIQDTLDLEVEALPGMPRPAERGNEVAAAFAPMVGAASQAQPKENKDPKPANKPKAKATIQPGPAPPPPPPPASREPLGDGEERKNRPCLFCKKTGHPIHKCPMSTKERRQALMNDKRCYNCLIPGHPANSCNKEHNCRLCAKDNDPKGLQYKHITFICNKRDKNQKRSSENQAGPPAKMRKENNRSAPKRIQNDALEMIQRYLANVQVGEPSPAAKAEQGAGGQANQPAAANPAPTQPRQD